MSAATKERPPKNGAPQATQNEHAGGTSGTVTGAIPPLWGGLRVPIILLSGEVHSGKTMFCIDADPLSRNLDIAPTTCVWDQEGSAEPYCGGLNFEWKDTRKAVFDGLHRKIIPTTDADPKWRKTLLGTADVNDYPSASLFRAWYISLLNVESGKFRVGAVDTFTPLQEGLIEWLRCHPQAFGRSLDQYNKAASMFLWPDVKAVLSYILTVDCRLRFETFCITVHLKNEWKGNNKTGHRIAEGLDVLDKLATVHLELNRSAESKKKSAPRLPSAVVKKSRLVKFGTDESGDQPILPPRMPTATPNALRAYIRNPPDFANLKPEERMPDDAMTDDQRLILKAQISDNERATAEIVAETERSSMTRLERLKAAAERQAAAAASGTDNKGPVPEVGEWVNNGALNSGTATESQVREIKAQFPIVFSSNGQIGEYLASHGVGKVAELSESVAADVLVELLGLASKAKMTAAQAKLAGSGTTETPGRENASNQPAGKSAGLITKPSPDAPPPSPPDDPTLAEQRELFGGSDGDGAAEEITSPAGVVELASDVLVAKIKSLFPQVFTSNDQIKAALAERGVSKVAELTLVEANGFLTTLIEMKSGNTESASRPSSTPDAPAPSDPNDFDVSRAELEQIKLLCEKAGWDAHDQVKWLNQRGLDVRNDKYRAWRDVKSSDAQEAIKKLTSVIDGFSGGVPKN